MMKSGANSSSGSLAVSDTSAFKACSGAAASGAGAIAAAALSALVPFSLLMPAAFSRLPAMPPLPADACSTVPLLQSNETCKVVCQLQVCQLVISQQALIADVYSKSSYKKQRTTCSRDPILHVKSAGAAVICVFPPDG